MNRSILALCCVLPAGVAFAQNATLSFIKSPTTGKHVALQPRDDHHRIQALVRVKGGGGQLFEAELACLSHGRFTSDMVKFYVLKSDQTWAIFLRTPKRPNESAQYTIEVRPASDAGGKRLVYAWKIERMPDGTANIVKPPNGQTSQIPYVVSTPIPGRKADGTIEWKIVSETKTILVTVPEEFDFGVDQQGSQKPVYVSADPVN